MANAWLPVPGWDGMHEWESFVPFEEMVRSRDPETGYIVTANNQIASADYPHYISLQFGADHRARRITARLEDIQSATVQDMAAVHAEIVSIPAMRYKGLLAESRPGTRRSARRSGCSRAGTARCAGTMQRRRYTASSGWRSKGRYWWTCLVPLLRRPSTPQDGAHRFTSTSYARESPRWLGRGTRPTYPPARTGSRWRRTPSPALWHT